MPLYTYRCLGQGGMIPGPPFEAFRSIERRDDTPPCPSCSGPTERILTPPNIIVNPSRDGYFQNNKSGARSSGKKKVRWV